MSYETYLSVFLTAMGILLAVFAVAIGLIGIWGYNAFKDFKRKIQADLRESNARRQAAEDRFDEIDSLIETKIIEILERQKLITVNESTINSKFNDQNPHVNTRGDRE